MRSAVDGVDVVGIGIDDLVVAVVVLQGDLADGGAVLLLEIERLGEERLVPLVELFHQLADPALVAEAVRAHRFAAPVGEGDRQPLVEKGKFLEADAENVVLEHDRLENFGVGKEGDLGPRLIGIADDLKGTLGHAAVIHLFIDVAVLGHLHFQPFRERVDGLDADTVQAAGHLVARIAAEFSACVCGRLFSCRFGTLFYKRHG